jgi:hypothetical protein
MEATLEISLYSYLYLKLAKTLTFLLSHVFSSRKLENKRVEQVLPRSVGGQIMYTHVSKLSKCKSDKIKNNKNNSLLGRTEQALDGLF